MAKQEKDVRTRVEELVSNKADISKAEIADVLKKEGFKSRRGKALAPGSIAYYMPQTTAAATKKKEEAGAETTAPKKRRRVGPSAASQDIVQAVITLTRNLSAAVKNEIVIGLLKD